MLDSGSQEEARNNSAWNEGIKERRCKYTNSLKLIEVGCYATGQRQTVRKNKSPSLSIPWWCGILKVSPNKGLDDVAFPEKDKQLGYRLLNYPIGIYFFGHVFFTYYPSPSSLYSMCL